MRKRWSMVALLAVLALLVAAAMNLRQTPAGSFDRQAWLEDYAWLKTQLQQSYANLAWFGSGESGVDLPALDRRTRRALGSAENAEDAKSAILAFVAGFHDGHFEPAPVLQPPLVHAVALPKLALDQLSATDGCAALGYVPVRSLAFSLPFDALSGASIEADGVSRAFRAGVVRSIAGTRFGIVRISRFRPQDAPPASCVEEWTARRKAGLPIDADALRERIAAAWFEILAAQLKQFAGEGVAAVLVDLGGNPGGNDSGDWAVRLFTAGEVHSPRLLLTAAASANAYFDEQLQGLRQALAHQPQGDATLRRPLQAAIAQFEQRQAALPASGCDLSWVWHEHRPWNPAGCSRLIEAGFASGALDYLPSGALGRRETAAAAYWAAAVDPLRGAWSGPVYILTDGHTASSAEMFTAVSRDNGIARTVGAPTEGDGCGFMDDDEMVELPHSHLRFHLPNCVRLRADGSDEVAGIKPDLPVLPTQGEDGRARAARVLESIDADLHKPRETKAATTPPAP